MGHVAMMGTAIFFAGSYLFAKHLTNRVSAETVVIMLSILVTIGLFPLAYIVWVPPRVDELIILLGSQFWLLWVIYHDQSLYGSTSYGDTTSHIFTANLGDFRWCSVFQRKYRSFCYRRRHYNSFLGKFYDLEGSGVKKETSHTCDP